MKEDLEVQVIIKMLSNEEIKKVLNKIEGPESGLSLGEHDIIKNVDTIHNKVRVTVALPKQGYPVRENLIGLIKDKTIELNGTREVEVIAINKEEICQLCPQRKST
jgi:metal-sulfur cluster biosynthetic enzyme